MFASRNGDNFSKMGKSRGNMPGNNQVQNQVVRDALNEIGQYSEKKTNFSQGDKSSRIWISRYTRYRQRTFWRRVTMQNKAIEAINRLINQPLQYICRESDMGDLGFGDLVEFKNHKGAVLLRPRYAIHLQCPFRIIRGHEQIILTSYDMYLDLNGTFMPDMSWDEQGVNGYDNKVDNWLKSNPDLIVKHVNVNGFGDLKLIFNNNDSLETFVSYSTDDECWRFFRMDVDESHLVITGKGARLR